MLFFAAGGQNLVKRYIVPDSPLHERLKGVPRVRFTPTRSRYVQVDKAGPGFLTLDSCCTPGASNGTDST